MIIYKITNKINGKVYVGQTRQKLAVRWRQHGYKKSNSSFLKKALDKYGKTSFSLEVLLETQDQIVLNTAEVDFIKQFNSLAPNGYNLTTGGEGGYTRSAETRRLLSEAGKGKGRPHTAESKAKISAAHSGANHHNYGKKQSEETKAKRSASLMGRKRPPEVIAKIKANHNPKSNLNLTFRRPVPAAA